MKPLLRLLGSIRIAVPVLITIAITLAWGTIYEARFGTAAVQHVVYRSWWFQTLLGFLAVNLAMAAWERYPWKRQHVPFVLAHLGIILILLGGIMSGRFGVDGQLIVPEGQASKTLLEPYNVLAVHHRASHATQMFPTKFDTQAWVQEPKATFAVPVGSRTLQLVADRYYPDAQVREEITGDGADDFPAVHLRLTHAPQEELVWLFAKDSGRFGVGWGEAHVLFLAPETSAELDQLLGRAKTADAPRGVVSIRLPGKFGAHELDVPQRMGQPMAISGTPYTVTFKDYFPDFFLSEQGLGSRSDQPNNPSVSLTLSGPEGTDAYLLFARHPDFASMHGFQHVIEAEVRYVHGATGGLPPNTIALIQRSSGLLAVLTGADGARTTIDRVETGRAYEHPGLGYAFEVATYYPKAKVVEEITNRSRDVRAEAVHVTGRLGDQTAAAWVWLRQSAQLRFGDEVVDVEYRPHESELPVTVKLLDFRKITYPGSAMAAGFESDVQLSDLARGVILMRKISMNNPLKYRGYTFFQSNYVEGPVETTILTVRKDPGTPFVYAGFLIVIGGVVTMFATRPATPKRRRRPRAKSLAS